jgi:hypothetical protein
MPISHDTDLSAMVNDPSKAVSKTEYQKPHTLPTLAELGAAAVAHVHAPVYFDAGTITTTTALGLADRDVVRFLAGASLTVTTTVPAAGYRRTVRVDHTGTTARTVTFGTGFKPTTTLSTGTTTARTFLLTFVSDGTNLYEAARTAAMAT